MGLADLAKKRTTSGGGGKTENVVVQITEFVLADKAKSSGDKDLVRGILSAPAFGLDAGTQVTLRLRPDPKEGTRGENKERRDIYRLTKKAGAGDPVKVGGLVEFQRAYVEKDGTINAAWLKALICDPEAGIEHAFPSVLACVETERKRKGEGAGSYQNAVLADASGAIQVKNIDELRAAVADVLARENIGSPGFIFRAIDLSDGVRAATRWTRRSKKDAAGNYVSEDVGEAIAAFEASESGKPYLEYLATYANAVYEVIPTITVPLGSKMVASSSDRGNDMAEPYAIKLKSDDGKDHKVSGYMVSNVAFRRPATDSDFWFVTHSNPVVNGDERMIYDYADIPTPNMPAHVRDLVDKAAKAHEVHIGSSDATYGEEHTEAPALNA